MYLMTGNAFGQTDYMEIACVFREKWIPKLCVMTGNVFAQTD